MHNVYICILSLSISIYPWYPVFLQIQEPRWPWAPLQLHLSGLAAMCHGLITKTTTGLISWRFLKMRDQQKSPKPLGFNIYVLMPQWSQNCRICECVSNFLKDLEVIGSNCCIVLPQMKTNQVCIVSNICLLSSFSSGNIAWRCIPSWTCSISILNMLQFYSKDTPVF